MTRIAALILADAGRDVVFAGISLVERGVQPCARAPPGSMLSVRLPNVSGWTNPHLRR